MSRDAYWGFMYVMRNDGTARVRGFAEPFALDGMCFWKVSENAQEERTFGYAILDYSIA